MQTGLDERELRRIRAVTLHFTELQGLRGTVQVGLYLCSWSVSGLLRGYIAAIAHILSVVVFGFSVPKGPLGRMASRFYRKRFGEVEALGTQRWESALAVHGPRYFGGVEGPLSELPVPRPTPRVGLLRKLMMLLMLAICWISVFVLPAGQALWLVSGGASAFLLWRWAFMKMGSAQLYLPVLACLSLSFALLAGPAVASLRFLAQLQVSILLPGVLCTLTGLFDHRLLTRILPPAPPDVETDAAQEER